MTFVCIECEEVKADEDHHRHGGPCHEPYQGGDDFCFACGEDLADWYESLGLTRGLV